MTMLHFGVVACSLPLSAFAGKIDCFWTANTHQHTDLFGKLSPALRSGLSAQTTTVYPGSVALRISGFIDYPTELFMVGPPQPTSGIATGSGCSAVINDTGTYEGSYTHVAAATIDDCCNSCSVDAKCKFALYQRLNPTPTHHCWMMNATSLTPRPEKGTQLITVTGKPAPPPPPTVYWKTAWEHNLVAMPASMVQWIRSELNGTAEGLLMVDYEPPWRPSWRFPNPNGTAQPRWAAFLAAVHADSIDTNWTSLVGWVPPAAATDWASLTETQQAGLQETSWEFFAKAYLTTALRAVKAALPPKVELSFWNWPFKFGKSGLPPWWDGVMDDIGWLWKELPVFMPDLYPEFYSGTEQSMPAALSPPRGRCEALGAEATTSYFQANVDNALRLKKKWNPNAKVYLSVWWHYMCSQAVTQDLGYFVNDGNLPALFAATGHDGIAVWGSIGDFKGEDQNASEVESYLDHVWAPYVTKHCLPVKADDP